MTELELFRRYEQTKKIPYVSLGMYPTPVERMETIGRNIGVPNLFVKRDDQSGRLYGGNKIRKLEFLLADAKAQGKHRVWTVGAIGSHHVLATSIYAREIGLEPVALHFPQPITNHVLEVLKALSTTRPDLTLSSDIVHLSVAMAKQHIKDRLAREPDAYYIPGGGSSPIGVLGYVNAALELHQQVQEGLLPEPDVIFVAAGTCGTLAGLALGCRMAGMKTRVIGVRVVDKYITNVPVTVRLANKAAQILKDYGVDDVPRLRNADVALLHEYFGKAYGEPTAEGLALLQQVWDEEDVELDPTYTAKAFAAIAGHKVPLELAHKNVLYWHTLSSADLTERIREAQVEWDLPREYHDFF
jgi:1-aminocyclopropane-1-carboxylate deaminase/D-cysteine desulfhydrase-like pyridoxal-dependent ACC family enzyme